MSYGYDLAIAFRSGVNNNVGPFKTISQAVYYGVGYLRGCNRATSALVVSPSSPGVTFSDIIKLSSGKIYINDNEVNL